MALIASTPKMVTVFGGSGFLGRHVVRALARRGYLVRVACRRPDLAGHLQPLGNVGQIQAIQANLRYRWSIERALAESDHAVNCVGILAESGKNSFEAVQRDGAARVARLAAENGVEQLVQISAIGADAESASEYAQTKAAGEKAVKHCRAGKGPYILEIKTYRYRGHSMSDPAKYRTREEVSKMREERDPIDHVRDMLVQGGHASEEDLKAIDKEIKAVVNASAEFARESPEPALDELWTDIYADT